MLADAIYKRSRMYLWPSFALEWRCVQLFFDELANLIDARLEETRYV